jgi:hypothetical protein
LDEGMSYSRAHGRLVIVESVRAKRGAHPLLLPFYTVYVEGINVS